MAQKFKARYITFPIFIIVIFTIIWYVFSAVTGIFSLRWFVDRAVVAGYQPSGEIVELASASGMNSNGKFYFYTGTPALNNSTEFNVNCADVISEQSIVLGCYTGKIYIFNVTDERIAGVKTVTAAHEMLHAAYERLGLWEKERIDNLITKQFEQTTDQKILDAVAIYDKLEPNYRINELHSIFGTEVRDLSDELAEYYGRYFSNRDLTVSAAEQYEAVFRQMEQRAVELETQLTVLESEVNTMTADYESKYYVLSRDIDVFNSTTFTNEAAFYGQRNALLARQNQLNVLADTINAKIDQYNQYAKELQNLGREAKKLQDNIDSQAQIQN